MIKIEKGNRYIELTIIGYQFPADENGYYDSNWLQIMLNADDGKTVWSKIDPSLLTIELIKAAAWFRDLSDGRNPVSQILSFIEPCLSFEYSLREGMCLLSVRFTSELSPFSKESDSLYIVELELSKAELADIAGQFECEFLKFPPRGEMAGTKQCRNN
ncbi:MAG TPA: hypothetical protein PK624_13555 [Spirochaetota bacterium]|nr:hypothetical protein [Spirochaetota bacterium]HOR45814.1 hypothetical protein [Spirochaetota bacterium]HPK56141.1 hypothetical protein [Spirochaetota bacterium]